MPDLPEVRGAFGPRETFYLVFAAVAGGLLLVLTVRDALGGVVGAPAVGLTVVTGLAFLIVFGGSDREDRTGDGGDPDRDPDGGDDARGPGPATGDEAHGSRPPVS